jgi:hypothetical protein
MYIGAVCVMGLWCRFELQSWVRRLFVLIRREQIDELDDSATNVLHELCQFESDSSHAECLGSIILEEVVKFEYGVTAGLPEHEKVAYEEANRGKKKKRKDDGDLWTSFKRILPVNIDTDYFEDYTIQFQLPNRILRLRYEKNTLRLCECLSSRLSPPAYAGQS